MKLFIIALAALAACGGDDPVSYSQPVGINLKAESGAVSGSALSDEKGITTESGNPYGAFITGANNKLGHEPGRIEIDSIALTLGAGSTGVLALEQIYVGPVEVLFLMNDTNTTYAAGTVIDPSGTTKAVNVSFDPDKISDVDWPKFVGGSFKVVIRGTAATGFATKGAKADLQLTFTFAAFE
jgi:hypothetical protein